MNGMYDGDVMDFVEWLSLRYVRASLNVWTDKETGREQGVRFILKKYKNEKKNEKISSSNCRNQTVDQSCSNN